MNARSEGRSRRGSAGISLVEVLIAMMILAGGLLTLATAQIQSMTGGQRGRHLSQAAAVAESQLEQLQRMRWTNIPAQPWTAPAPVTNAVQTAAGVENETTYQVSYQITDLTAGKTRAIDVRVTWTEPDGRNRAVTISSIRNNYEAL